MDCHCPEWDPRIMRRVNPKNAIATLERAKVNTYYVFAKCHHGNSYYDTKVGHKHVGLGDRDMLGEFVKECRKAGIAVVAYYSVGWDARAARSNPDWCMRDSEGEKMYAGNWDAVCVNSPYRDYVYRQLKEVVSNYDIDGILLDIVGFHVDDKVACYCDYCKRLFKAKFGRDIPVEPNWKSPLWVKFVLWRYDVMTSFLKEVSALIRDIKTNLPFTHNFAGSLTSWSVGQDIEDASSVDDFLFADIYWQREGTLCLSRNPRFYQSLSRGRPQTLIVRFLWPWDWMISPKSLLMAEAMSGIANGNGVTFIDHHNFDGSLEERVYDIIGEVFNEVERREEWLMANEPILYAALYFSQSSRDFYGREDPGKYNDGFDATYKSLLEDHIIFSVIHDKYLNSEALAKFKVLVLPNAGCLTEDQIDEIREYVRSGGGLVATYKTSLYNEFGEQRSNFSLADVFGANYSESLNYSDSYIKLTGKHDVTSGVPDVVPLLVTEPQLKVEVASQRDVLAKIVLPLTEHVPRARWFSHGSPPPDMETDYPAILAGKFGKGRVVYFASSLETVYLKRGYPYAQKLLANATRWAGGEPQITACAPVSIEVTAYRQPNKNRIIVHLTNFQTELSRSITGAPSVIREIMPAYDIIVSVKVPEGAKISEVYLAPERERLEFEFDHGRLRIKVPKVDIHKMVVIQTRP